MNCYMVVLCSLSGLTKSLSLSGVHIVQRMYGCEWDDDTADVTGFNQYGYDGEDFLWFDLRTGTWIAPRPQSVDTKMKWDHNKLFLEADKQYLTHECADWLKKYLEYGKSSLQRTGRITWHEGFLYPE